VPEEGWGFALNPPLFIYLSYEALRFGMQVKFLKAIDRIKTVDMKERETVRGWAES
jgi:hypothetical protein